MDILNATQSIRRFVNGMTKEDLLVDGEKYEAVHGALL